MSKSLRASQPMNLVWMPAAYARPRAGDEVAGAVLRHHQGRAFGCLSWSTRGVGFDLWSGGIPDAPRPELFSPSDDEAWRSGSDVFDLLRDQCAAGAEPSLAAELVLRRFDHDPPTKGQFA